MSGRRTRMKGFIRKPRVIYDEDELINSFADMGFNQPDRPNLPNFDGLGLHPNLLKGIHALGLEKPAGIQEKAILPCIKGRDVILQAQSGMGKTAAFCIASLQRITMELPNVQVLAVTPTRELAEQIQNTFLILSRYMGIRCITCIGGSELARDKRKFDKNVHVVVGTLGRLIHMYNLNYLHLETIRTLIFDESDKMLMDGSYRGDMRKLLQSISGDTQIILSSATMPLGALKKAKTFMYKPLKFLLSNTELTLEGIKQFYIQVETEMDKLETFVDIYPVISKSHTMVFASTRAIVKIIKNRLLEKDINITSIVGASHQTERNKALTAFRNLSSPVILTTDLLGRGIDIQQVYAVINFDLPMNHVDYIHRVGRCGRYGRKGIAINLVTSEEKAELDEIAEFFGTDINEMPTDISKYF